MFHRGKETRPAMPSVVRTHRGPHRIFLYCAVRCTVCRSREAPLLKVTPVLRKATANYLQSDIFFFALFFSVDGFGRDPSTRTTLDSPTPERETGDSNRPDLDDRPENSDRPEDK